MKKRSNVSYKICIICCVTLILFSSCFVLLLSLHRHSHQSEPDPTFPETTEERVTRSPTVIIDAGHGGEDGGAIGTNGVLEKHLNLAVALELEQMLSANGIKTRLTRETDTLLYDRNSNYQGHKKAQDAAARISIAEEYEDAIFISIHMNSFSQSKYSGLQVYYSENSQFSPILAEAVQSVCVRLLQPDNQRAIKPAQNNVYILQKITHPAILIECGFLSNAEECEALCSEQYRSKLCVAIYSAIINYFENTKLTT